MFGRYPTIRNSINLVLSCICSIDFQRTPDGGSFQGCTIFDVNCSCGIGSAIIRCTRPYLTILAIIILGSHCCTITLNNNCTTLCMNRLAICTACNCNFCPTLDS